jgi:hypothetical protein
VIERLPRLFPQTNFVVLGVEGPTFRNVKYRKSGSMTNEQVSDLFARADIVLFPSYYEGFGFPLMEALAHQRPVLVRKLVPFEEIASKLELGADNIHWFGDLGDLERLLRRGVSPWKGGPARGEPDGWQRSALEILEGIRVMIEAATLSSVSERYLAFQKEYGPDCPPESPPERASRLIGESIETLVARLLRVKWIYRSARIAWLLVGRFGWQHRILPPAVNVRIGHR